MVLVDPEANETLRSLVYGQASIVLHVAMVHYSSFGLSVAGTFVQL